MEQLKKFKGWKRKTVKEVGFLKCPNCESEYESLIVKDGLTMCYHCKAKFPKERFAIVEKDIPAVVCAECDFEVSLTPGNINWVGISYLCPKCLNIVGMVGDGKALQPWEVLN